MTEDQVRQFEKVEAQVEGFFDEIGVLSKKKPDDAINRFKLDLVNQILEQANDLLGDTYRPFASFRTFDVDTLPSTSDVVVMLGQYLRSLDKFRKDHSSQDYATSPYYWDVSESTTRHKAKAPKSFT